MRWKKGRSQPSLAQLQRGYQAACDAEDYPRQEVVLTAITDSYPDVSWGWYDLGRGMKWQRNWTRSRDANIRAMKLLDDPANAAEAWNLGIAATALGDWSTARQAWTAFGLALPDGPVDQPIFGDFGLTPVRLNPDPRFAEPEFTVVGVRYATEVVWATRLCPTRARIENVPLPDSGHRRGDVVLHDGDPVGQRQLGDSVRSVFNEIALMERGPHATLTTVIEAPPDYDLNMLQTLFGEHGYGIESWAQGLRMLCKACSEGAATSLHNHPPGRTMSDGTVTLGIAAPMNAATELLDSWLAPNGLERGPILEANVA